MIEKIYIAGPIRNKACKNQGAFAAAKEHLQKAFPLSKVFTPFDLARFSEIEESEDAIDKARCRRFAQRDLAMILDCDAIYMLTGWEHSTGAKAEHAVARWLQLEIIYESTEGDGK